MFQITGLKLSNVIKQILLFPRRAIVSTLSTAVESCLFPIPKLTVLTDATTQKICLRKYAAQESKIEVGVAVSFAYLMFWVLCGWFTHKLLLDSFEQNYIEWVYVYNITVTSIFSLKFV